MNNVKSQVQMFLIATSLCSPKKTYFQKKLRERWIETNSNIKI